MEENNVNNHPVKFFVTCLSVVFALGLSAVAVLAEEFDPNPAGPQINAENVAAFFDTAFDVQRQDHKLTGAVFPFSVQIGAKQS